MTRNVWVLEWRERSPYSGRETEVFGSRSAALRAFANEKDTKLYAGEHLRLYRAVVDADPIKTAVGTEPPPGCRPRRPGEEKTVASDFGCSFPGCDRHPRNGDTILRISAKGKGMVFVGRCEEHYGDESGPELARGAEDAARVWRSVEEENHGLLLAGQEGKP